MTSHADGGRLPDAVRPETYDLRVTVRPAEGHFTGRVRIAVRLIRPSRTITLHAQDLAIDQAGIEFAGGTVPVTWSLDPEATTLTLTAGREIAAGAAVLDLAFSGTLNRQMKGLYEARAIHDGLEERYAFTQFEPTDARRAFPCFDEPGFKAAFRVTVTAPADLTVLSNMPIANATRDGGTQTVRFDETPVMSTYLLAVAVGRLAPKARRVAGTRVAVWALPRDLTLADFALDVAEATLPLLNDYFDLAYPYPKLDLVAVPDFAMGAMENWGAIFFRDSRLLVDPARASTATLRVVANVIVHEIVHQWFGNLVTMAWWDDLWLNEAFATWLACKIVDRWRPEWRSWDEFQHGKETPLALDALDSSRPIVADVRSPAEIEAMFDPLTYEKGASVLRMIEHFLGEDAFREGIRSYIARHQFRNTVASDLWRELEAASGRPVGALAKDWLAQAGYPIVTVRAASGDHRTLQFRQRKFSAHGASSRPETWSIPMVIRYRDQAGVHAHRLLLSAPDVTVTLPGSGPVRWVYPNGGASGFYRVKMESPLGRPPLADGVSALEPAERIGLLNDLWALARAGDGTIEDFMEALTAFAGDGTRVVVEALSGYLDTLSEYLVADSDRPRLAAVVEQLFGPVGARLGWGTSVEEDDEPRLARAAAVWSLATVGGARAWREEALARLESYLGDPSTLDPTLATTLIRIGAQWGDSARFADYQRRFERAATPDDRDRYLTALAEFHQPDLSCRLMDLTLTDAVRGQDLWKPYRVLLSRPAVQAEAWEFVKAHWPMLQVKAGPIGATRIIQSTKALWREEWHAEVSAFFRRPSNRVESAEKALDQTLEFLRLGIRFNSMQRQPLARWLQARAR